MLLLCRHPPESSFLSMNAAVDRNAGTVLFINGMDLSYGEVHCTDQPGSGVSASELCVVFVLYLVHCNCLLGDDRESAAVAETGLSAQHRHN